MSYDPAVARWTETDPEEYIDGPNLYEFEGATPDDNSATQNQGWSNWEDAETPTANTIQRQVATVVDNPVPPDTYDGREKIGSPSDIKTKTIDSSSGSSSGTIYSDLQTAKPQNLNYREDSDFEYQYRLVTQTTATPQNPSKVDEEYFTVTYAVRNRDGTLTNEKEVDFVTKTTIHGQCTVTTKQWWQVRHRPKPGANH